jgi:hypothetical protein
MQSRTIIVVSVAIPSPSLNSQRCLPLCLLSSPVTWKTLCLPKKKQGPRFHVAGVKDGKSEYIFFHLNLHEHTFTFLVQCMNNHDGTPCETCVSQKEFCEYTYVPRVTASQCPLSSIDSSPTIGTHQFKYPHYDVADKIPSVHCNVQPASAGAGIVMWKI